MTEYEQNSAIKISTEDEKQEVIQKIQLDQTAGFFKATESVKKWHDREIDKFLDAKTDQSTLIEQDESNLGYIKDKANLGELGSITGWNMYGQATQGGMTVPFLMNDFPNFYRTNGTDTNAWTVLQDGNNVILRRPVRFLANKGFEVNRGYSLTAPASKVIDTLKENASLDDLGNVFGKQELSVFSSNLALAFNGVSDQFSLMQLFLKSLLYASQKLSEYDNTRNEMLSDPFPRLKATQRRYVGTIGRSDAGENLGFGSDADTCGVTWCTMGQLAAMKRGALRYPPVANNKLGIQFILESPEEWALVPVDGDVLSAYEDGAAEINGNYVASHLKYPCFINQYSNTYDNRWLLTNIFNYTTTTDVDEIPIAACNNIGGAHNICFVLKNNMNTTTTAEMHINFGGVDVTVRHFSEVPLTLTAAQAAAFETSCMNEPTLGCAELLKQYGTSEGLELALKYLPIFTYGYMQTPLMNTNNVDGRMFFCCRGGNTDDKSAALNRLNSAICDPFCRGYDTVSGWYSEDAPPVKWAKNYVYKLPAYTQMQSIGVAARVFQNLGSWKMNEWNIKSTMNMHNFMPFLVDGVFFTDLLESLNRKTGAVYGAINSIGARGVGMPMSAVWEQTDMQWATLNLQFNELLMQKYLQKEVHNSARLIGNASNNTLALSEMWGNYERQYNQAFNVSITNLYAVGLMLNSKKLLTERFNEIDNKSKIAIRDIENKTYKGLSNSWDTVNLNLMGAVRIALTHTDTFGGGYDATQWFASPWNEHLTRFMPNWVRMNFRTRNVARDTIAVRFGRSFSHEDNLTTGTSHQGTDSIFMVELINPFHNKLPGAWSTADDYYKVLRTNSGSTHAVEMVETDDDPWSVAFSEDFCSVKQDFDEMANAFRE